MWHPPERIRHPLPETRWPTAEEAASAQLFQPIDIGSVRARQRTWVPAMVPWRATEGGLVTPDVIDWYARFAEGRPGVLVVEATGIRDIPSGPLLRIGHERFVPGLAELVRAVKHASGGETLVFIQLIDFLRIKRRPSKEAYFGRFLELGDQHRERLASLLERPELAGAAEDEVRRLLVELDEQRIPHILSHRELADYLFGYRERVWDLHLEHIRELPRVLPDLFADAAARAFEAGFDGVELHYAHAYTMASFLSALNTRNDGYGGSPEQRIRLPREVAESVRARVGRGRVLGVRFLGDDVIEGGNRVDDATYFAVELARAGVDYLSVSKGGKFEDAQQPKVGRAAYPYTGPSGYECMPTVFSDERGPFGRNVNLSAAVRVAVRAAGMTAPVIASGGIGSFELAEGILQSGEADIVAAARQSLADPDWFLKMRLGQGSAIRRCEYTNYCEGLDQQHKQVTCKLWDRVGLDQPEVKLDVTSRRRLVAPRWPGPTGVSPSPTGVPPDAGATDPGRRDDWGDANIAGSLPPDRGGGRP
jgi:2,4-dienoyl-CoA reductase-like NADH-dependent reductase (Old Yellow Enzyme family)